MTRRFLIGQTVLVIKPDGSKRRGHVLGTEPGEGARPPTTGTAYIVEMLDPPTGCKTVGPDKLEVVEEDPAK
jgi:hypothetical protein